MKKRIPCIILIVVLAFSLCAMAFADSKYMAASSTSTIFFSQVVNSGGVTINQTIAGFNGEYAGTIWHMYENVGNDYSSVTFTGDEGATPTTKSIYPRAGNSGKNHRLSVENCAPFNIYVVYTYTIN